MKQIDDKVFLLMNLLLLISLFQINEIFFLLCDDIILEIIKLSLPYDVDY
jgi:hypothetical protein